MESSFYAEAVGDRSVAPKILRSLYPVLELPSPARFAPPCKICVKMPPSADSFRAATVNALLGALPIAGLALLSLLVERGVVRNSFAEDAARFQRERLCSGAVDMFTFVVDLSRSDLTDARDAQDALRMFLNLDNEAIVFRASLINFPGITVTDTLLQ